MSRRFDRTLFVDIHAVHTAILARLQEEACRSLGAPVSKAGVVRALLSWADQHRSEIEWPPEKDATPGEGDGGGGASPA